MKALLLGTVLAMSLHTGVQTQYSEDGDLFRLVNRSGIAWYCIIKLGDGSVFERILYAGRHTPWYSRRGGWSWSCDG